MSDAPLTKDPRDVEFQAIGALIRAGQESGLLAELIWSFGMDRAGGSSVPEAVEYALCWRKWIDASKNPNREAEMSDSHSADQQVPAWPEEPQRLTAGRYGEVQWGYAEYRGDFDYIGRKYEFDRAEAAIARLKRVTEWMKGRMPCASGECCDELRQMIELCEVPNE